MLKQIAAGIGILSIVTIGCMGVTWMRAQLAERCPTWVATILLLCLLLLGAYCIGHDLVRCP